MLVGEKLEALGETLFGAMPLGKWAHQLGVVNNEAWADALGLEVLTDELVNKTGSRARCTALNIVINAELVKQLAGLLRLEVTTTRKLDIESLLQALHHLDAAERGSEIDLVDLVGILRVIHGMVVDLVGTMDGLDHLG